MADVYRIPKMVLHNGESSIVFHNAHLAVVSKDRFGTNLIMPSSVFKNANILISQIQFLPEKLLVFQCHSLEYTMKFTKYVINENAAKLLRKHYNIHIFSGQEILGVEDGFDQELTQLANLVLTKGNVLSDR